MTLIFDTSILVQIERGNKEIIETLRELSEAHPGQPMISFITYYEFYRGVILSKAQDLENAEKFLNNFICLETTEQTSKILAEMDVRYRKKGMPILLADLIIACQALENKATIITTDKDFAKIDEIQRIIV